MLAVCTGKKVITRHDWRLSENTVAPQQDTPPQARLMALPSKLRICEPQSVTRMKLGKDTPTLAEIVEQLVRMDYVVTVTNEGHYTMLRCVERDASSARVRGGSVRWRI